MDRRDVDALDLATRMREPMRRIAISGKKEHTFGEIIEAADVGEPRRRRHQIEHGSPALGIGARRHDSRRLVEHEPGGPGGRRNRSDAAAVNSDVVPGGVDRFADLGNVIVDGDAACRHELLGMASRSNAGTRERALDAHRLGHSRLIQRCGCLRAERDRQLVGTRQLLEMTQCEVLEKDGRRTVHQRTAEPFAATDDVDETALVE